MGRPPAWTDVGGACSSANAAGGGRGALVPSAAVESASARASAAGDGPGVGAGTGAGGTDLKTIDGTEEDGPGVEGGSHGSTPLPRGLSLNRRLPPNPIEVTRTSEASVLSPHAAAGSGVEDALSGEASAWGFALAVPSREALAQGLVVPASALAVSSVEASVQDLVTVPSGEASVARGTARSAGGGIGGGIRGGVESGVRRWRVGSGRRESNTSPLGILSSREGILSSRRSCCRLSSSRRLIVSSSSHRVVSCRVVSDRSLIVGSPLSSPRDYPVSFTLSSG